MSETPHRRDDGRGHPWRWWSATALVALLTVGTAPVMGLVRDALLRRFPGSALKVLAAVLAVLVASAILWTVRGALRRSGAGDPRRLILLAVALGVLAVQLLGFQTRSLQVDIVEKVHVVQYGLIAFLAARAVRQSGSGSDASRDELGPEHLWLPICLGATVGAVDESVQGFFQLRTGDVRDVALNALASVTGSCFAAATAPWSRLRGRVAPRARRRLGRVTALALLAVGAFFYEAHLGYVIRDPELGRFHSWFTAEELERLAEDRRRQWAENPPTGLVAWAPQDYFLTEAAWHANHRNERLGAEDFTAARQADRILETYYDPFLDVESFRGSGKHRWRPELRAEVDRQAEPVDPELYVSPVLSRRIYPWPKPIYGTLWLLSVLVALGLGELGFGGRSRSVEQIPEGGF